MSIANLPSPCCLCHSPSARQGFCNSQQWSPISFQHSFCPARLLLINQRWRTAAMLPLMSNSFIYFPHTSCQLEDQRSVSTVEGENTISGVVVALWSHPLTRVCMLGAWDLELSRAGFKFCLCSLLVVWLQGNYLPAALPFSPFSWLKDTQET